MQITNNRRGRKPPRRDKTMTNTNQVINMGSYPIWFWGSRKTLPRVVKRIGSKYYVTWYGNQIEVERGINGHFRSVDSY